MKVTRIIPLVLAFAICSCGVKRFVPENETLYKGATFNISADANISGLAKVKEELQAVLRPQPNSSKLGLLARYKVNRGKPGFIYRFLDKKFGEAPVYQSDVDVTKTENLILNRLENLGFFYSEVTSEIKTQTKTSKVTYSVTLKQPYRMNTYQLDVDSLPITAEIKKSLGESVIKMGDRFNLATLKFERERIDSELKSNGYYNFNADFLIFELDTNQYDNKRFDLYVRLKKNTPKKALIPYTLESINVFPNYSINANYTQTDTLQLDGVNFIQDPLFFKPTRLRPYIVFEKGQFYDPKKFRTTSRRLSSISTYKLVNVQFDEKPVGENDSIGFLHANVFLSPLNKRALSAELQGNSKSNGFTGPTLALSYTDRNLMKGGETVKVTGEFGYETQLGGNSNGTTGLSSTQLALNAEFSIPRLLFPIAISEQFQYNVPRTTIATGVEYLNRSKLYSLYSFNASFGYQWSTNDYVFHTINPISTSLIKLANNTPEFDAILEENPFLQSSFEQQLISGLTYNFTYNELGKTTKRNPLYFSANLDLAGNSLGLISSKDKDSGKKNIFGVEFAQYFKIDVDGRINMNIGNKQSLVTRLYGGYGYAYGNSTVMPFSRQFFSGGPYSIRAFRSHSVGPGTYTPDDTSTTSYFDRSGDIKLEANIEYRFPVYSFLKGALFMDAGNVWLGKENADLPGGKFSSNFINELAIGAGAGLRIDVQGFVIRFDWAAPIHNPQLNTESSYTFDAGNGVFNFAIGYPF